MARKMKNVPKKDRVNDPRFGRVEPVEKKLRLVEVLPRTTGQKKALNALLNKDVVILVGEAGTGKTYMSAYAVLSKLMEGKVDKILLSRPMVGVGNKDIGSLPGNAQEKVGPYLAPIIEAMKDIAGSATIDRLLQAEIIQIVPIALLRGYTFKRVAVIIDEVQNTIPIEFKTILTRVGEESSLFMLADPEQSDLKGGFHSSGLADFLSLYEPNVRLNRYLELARLTEKDIVRSEFVKEIVTLYKKG